MRCNTRSATHYLIAATVFGAVFGGLCQAAVAQGDEGTIPVSADGTDAVTPDGLPPLRDQSADLYARDAAGYIQPYLGFKTTAELNEACVKNVAEVDWCGILMNSYTRLYVEEKGPNSNSAASTSGDSSSTRTASKALAASSDSAQLSATSPRVENNKTRYEKEQNSDWLRAITAYSGDRIVKLETTVAGMSMPTRIIVKLSQKASGKQGSNFVTATEGRIYLTPYIKIGAGQVASFKADMSATADTTLSTDNVAWLIQKATEALSPPPLLLTTFSKSNIKAAAQFVDQSLGNFFSVSINETKHYDFNLPDYVSPVAGSLSNTGIELANLQIILPGATRDTPKWNAKVSISMGDWSVGMERPLISIFSTQRLCQGEVPDCKKAAEQLKMAYQGVTIRQILDFGLDGKEGEAKMTVLSKIQATPNFTTELSALTNDVSTTSKKAVDTGNGQGTSAASIYDNIQTALTQSQLIQAQDYGKATQAGATYDAAIKARDAKSAVLAKIDPQSPEYTSAKSELDKLTNEAQTAAVGKKAADEALARDTGLVSGLTTQALAAKSSTEPAPKNVPVSSHARTLCEIVGGAASAQNFSFYDAAAVVWAFSDSDLLTDRAREQFLSKANECQYLEIARFIKDVAKPPTPNIH